MSNMQTAAANIVISVLYCLKVSIMMIFREVDPHSSSRQLGLGRWGSGWRGVGSIGVAAIIISLCKVSLIATVTAD